MRHGPKRCEPPLRGAVAVNALQRGFTLLELIVAMAILGFMLTIMSINSVKFLERYGEQTTLREIRSQIAQTRYRALAEGRRIVIGDGADELTMPSGWRIAADPPVVFMPSGACLGGELTIIAPSGRGEVWQLKPPECAFKSNEVSL